MEIKILGSESLGVRGLSCLVKTGSRKIFIDPGISLGLIRNGLMPHPVQIGVGRIIRSRIIEEVIDATDIVISHFHGDHIPLLDANPYQLSISQLKKVPPECKIWSNKSNASNGKIKQREEALIFGLGRSIHQAQGRVDESLHFSGPVPHGEKNSHLGKVTMTKISDGNYTFVHASDIQFLSEETIDQILEYQPNLVLASGPPIYIQGFTEEKKEKAWSNAVRLAARVETLVIDHHLFRCMEGIGWLSGLSEESGGNVICAADYMGLPRHMLEAQREKLYFEMPVHEDWHRLYAENIVDTGEYMDMARSRYEWFAY